MGEKLPELQGSKREGSAGAKACMGMWVRSYRGFALPAAIDMSRDPAAARTVGGSV